MADNPLIVALREVFRPLIEQSSKLPAALAYSVMTTVAIIVMVLLGVVVSGGLLWLLIVLIVASLTAFVITDWNARHHIGSELAVNKIDERDEQIIYDGNKEFHAYDFKGVNGYIWGRDGDKLVKTSPEGLGLLHIEDGGVLNVERANTEGIFEIWLRQYTYKGEDFEYIPKNVTISGKRKIRISCKAKVSEGEHTLRFVLKNHETKNWLANEKVRVTKNTWTQIDLLLRVDPMLDCWLRIDDEEISKAPSSIQICNLLVAEKIT